MDMNTNVSDDDISPSPVDLDQDNINNNYEQDYANNNDNTNNVNNNTNNVNNNNNYSEQDNNTMDVHQELVQNLLQTIMGISPNIGTTPTAPTIPIVSAVPIAPAIPMETEFPEPQSFFQQQSPSYPQQPEEQKHSDNPDIDPEQGLHPHNPMPSLFTSIPQIINMNAPSRRYNGLGQTNYSMMNPLYRYSNSRNSTNVDQDFNRFVTSLSSLRTHFNNRNSTMQPTNSLNNLLQQSLLDPSQKAYKQVLSDEGEKCIKYLKYTKEQFPNEIMCSMTLCDFKEDDEIAQLPCSHIFKKDAILKWLKNEKATCPVCRLPLKSKEKKKTFPTQNTVSGASAQENDTEASVGGQVRGTRIYRRPIIRRNQLLRNIINARIRQEEEADLQNAIMASLMDLESENENVNDTATNDTLSDDTATNDTLADDTATNDILTDDTE